MTDDEARNCVTRSRSLSPRLSSSEDPVRKRKLTERRNAVATTALYAAGAPVGAAECSSRIVSGTNPACSTTACPRGDVAKSTNRATSGLVFDAAV